MHFKAVTLSHNADTIFYLYWGNAANTTNTQDSAGVFSEYVGAYHLTGTADAKGLMTATNNGSTEADGKFGKAREFDGVDDSISLSGNMGDLRVCTIMGWLRRGTDNIPRWAGVFFIRDADSPASGVSINDNKFRMHWNNQGWNLTPDYAFRADEWNFFALKLTEGKVTFFFGRGAETLYRTQNKLTSATIPWGTVVHIGRDPAESSRYFKGRLDEIRIYSGDLDDNYIKTVYQNQRNPGAYFTTAFEEAS